MILWYCKKVYDRDSPVGRDSCRAFLMPRIEVTQMPRKPKHPCAYPGCRELVDGRYCEEHASVRNKEYERFNRDTNTKRRYGRCWKRIRDSYVKTHPFCEKCYENGVLVNTEEVHHKKPLSEGGTHDRDNLIALCKSCHSRIHAQNGRFDPKG